MAPLRDLDDRDLDRLLAGREVDGDLEAGDLAGLVDDVRATHLRPVAQDTRSRHLAAMTEAARLIPSTDPLPPVRARRRLRSLMPRNRFAATAAAVAAATVTVGLGTAGLAVAGVDLPDRASAAFKSVGLTLPNQVTGEQRAAQERENDVREFIAGTLPEDRRGCAFGQQVAELASGKELPDEAKKNCAKAEQRRAEAEERRAEREAGKDDARDQGDAADERASFGSETAEGAKGQREAEAEQRPAFGPDTAKRARDRAGDPGTRPDRQTNPGSSEQAPAARPDSAARPPAGVSPGPPDSAGGGPPAERGSGAPQGGGAR